MELARALAGQPRILLLDETLAGSASGSGRGGRVIRRLAQDGITIVIIEHTMQAMVRLVDRFVVLDHGAVLVEGKPGGRHARSARHRGLSRQEMERPMLKVEGLSAGYQRSARAQRRVDQRSTRGSSSSIVGPNGAGKTTLFKTISGILAPMSGSDQLRGRRSRYRAAPRGGRISASPMCPEGRQVFPSLTVMENLEMGAYTEAGRRDWKQQHRAHLHLAAGAGGSPHAARRHAVGRRAADGRDRARPRLVAEAPDAGRAVDGARADHRRFHLREADGDPPGDAG